MSKRFTKKVILKFISIGTILSILSGYLNTNPNETDNFSNRVDDTLLDAKTKSQHWPNEPTIFTSKPLIPPQPKQNNYFFSKSVSNSTSIYADDNKQTVATYSESQQNISRPDGNQKRKQVQTGSTSYARKHNKRWIGKRKQATKKVKQHNNNKKPVITRSYNESDIKKPIL